MQLLKVQNEIRYLPSDSAQPQISDKSIILHYLTHAPRVASIRTFIFDEIEPERHHPISLVFHSDGEWVWSTVTAYYVEQYDVRLPQDFVEQALEKREPPPSLTKSTRDEAMSLVHASLDSAQQ
jgi:hypothetical protein